MDRRYFFKNSLPVAVFSTGATSSLFANTNQKTIEHSFNVIDFGAKGDGKTDDTKAIQSAIDAASAVQGNAFVPAGIYMCGEIQMRKFSGLVGEAKWSFSKSGGSILRLNDANAKCLINLTESGGCRLTGICVDGSLFKKGKIIHGMFLANQAWKEEDGFQISTCRAENFSGDGFRFDHVWCYAMRHSHSYHNKGCGMRIQGWDGYIIDNWFSGNGEAGIGAYEDNASFTVTGNRIEWNAKGGIVIYGGNNWQLTGNYIDRSGGCGIAIYPRGNSWHQNYAITGNIIYRSGKPECGYKDEYDNAQVRFEGAKGLLFANNAMYTGRDDNGGIFSPDYGIVIKNLDDSIIKDNTLFHGALKRLILDIGGHGPNFIMKDNVGSVRPKDKDGQYIIP